MDRILKLEQPLELWIPIKKAKFKFSLKESVQLPALKMFLLLAIRNYNTGVEELVDSTMLSEQAIKQELQELYKQKLLSFDTDEKYILTGLSKRLLLFQEVVARLNSTDVTFAFNTLNGKAEKEDNDTYDQPRGVRANPWLSTFELTYIEPTQIKDTMLNAFPFIKEELDDTDNFLDSIIIEPEFEDKRSKYDSWKPMYISNIPFDIDKRQDDVIPVRYSLIQRKYRVYDEYFETNDVRTRELENICRFDKSFISDEGNQKLSEFKKYCEKRAEVRTIVINPVDSSICGDGAWNTESKVKRFAFDLDEFSQFLCDNVKIDSEISKTMSSKYQIQLAEPEEHIPNILWFPVDFLNDNAEDSYEDETCYYFSRD